MAAHDAEIPIVERGGTEQVGAILWHGTEAAGLWTFAPRGRGAHQREAEIGALVAQARKTFNWLRQVTYVGRGFVRQPGWHGFWGTANAFQRALPYVGLAVDWNAIHAPIDGLTPRADLLEE